MRFACQGGQHRAITGRIFPLMPLSAPKKTTELPKSQEGQLVRARGPVVYVSSAGAVASGRQRGVSLKRTQLFGGVQTLAHAIGTTAD
jgi:hypothetical protein